MFLVNIAVVKLVNDVVIELVNAAVMKLVNDVVIELVNAAVVKLVNAAGYVIYLVIINDLRMKALFFYAIIK
jgi:hypothetical protein